VGGVEVSPPPIRGVAARRMGAVEVITPARWRLKRMVGGGYIQIGPCQFNPIKMAAPPRELVQSRWLRPANKLVEGLEGRKDGL
jgi:hypothetical protein